MASERDATMQRIARFYHLRRSGDGFRGPCPIHGGRSGRSFAVRTGSKVDLLLLCFSRSPRCSYSALYDKLAADGLLPPRGIPESVTKVERAANAAQWVGRGKATERAVLLAHITIAKRAQWHYIDICLQDSERAEPSRHR
jgi:hypothetical protein